MKEIKTIIEEVNSINLKEGDYNTKVISLLNHYYKTISIDIHKILNGVGNGVLYIRDLVKIYNNNPDSIDFRNDYYNVINSYNYYDVSKEIGQLSTHCYNDMYKRLFFYYLEESYYLVIPYSKFKYDYTNDYNTDIPGLYSSDPRYSELLVDYLDIIANNKESIKDTIRKLIGNNTKFTAKLINLNTKHISKANIVYDEEDDNNKYIYIHNELRDDSLDFDTEFGIKNVSLFDTLNVRKHDEIIMVENTFDYSYYIKILYFHYLKITVKRQ